MNCEEFRDTVSDLLADGVDPTRSTDVCSHRDVCSECRRYLDEMSQTYHRLRPAVQIKASQGFKEKTMTQIARIAVDATPITRPAHSRLSYWKLAIAAAAVLALLLVAPFNRLFKPDTVAYALEQSIEANHALRTIHVKDEKPDGETVSEIWLEFDDVGGLARARTNWAKTEDGDKDVIWENGVAQVWFRQKNCILTTSAPEVLARITQSLAHFDPHQVLAQVKQDEKAGKVKVEIKGTNPKTGGITMTVTPSQNPDIVTEFLVDPESKFVVQKEQYRVKGTELLGRTKYMDYNRPLPPDVFTIHAPADVMKVDDRRTDIGLPKGNLTDNEIAAKVAREFFEALIAEDYDKAGLLLGATPGNRLKAMLKEVRFVRIIKMEEPRPHEVPETGGLQVPTEMEIEAGGQTVNKHFNLGVRPVRNQPDRWNVFGGF